MFGKKKVPNEPKRRYRALSWDDPERAAGLWRRRREPQATNYGSGERWVNDTTRSVNDHTAGKATWW